MLPVLGHLCGASGKAAQSNEHHPMAQQPFLEPPLLQVKAMAVFDASPMASVSTLFCSVQDCDPNTRGDGYVGCIIDGDDVDSVIATARGAGIEAAP